MRGKAKYLYAPALVSNPRIKEDLFENPTIYSVIEEGRVVDIEADYVCYDVPNEFIVGFGLDYDEKYRNLPYVGVLKEEIYTK